jgi:hypothetical protein
VTKTCRKFVLQLLLSGHLKGVHNKALFHNLTIHQAAATHVNPSYEALKYDLPVFDPSIDLPAWIKLIANHGSKILKHFQHASAIQQILEGKAPKTLDEVLTALKIVRHVLKRIANQSQVLYPDIKKKFVVDCDIEISLQFWELLREDYLHK